MKKLAERKHRPKDFKEGDMVLVKFNPRQFKALRGVHQNLVRKYEGPLKIVAKVGKISYKLKLPPHLKIHPVFHASVLKPYPENKDDPNRNKSQRAPITITSSYDQEMEAIIDYQAKRKQGQQAVLCFSYIGRDRLLKKPLGRSMKTCGSSMAKSRISCSDASQSSHH